MVPRRSKGYIRRTILGALGAAALFGPAAFSGCASNFTPPGKVETLRVLSVKMDHPYIPDNSDNPDNPDEWVLPEDCPGDAEHCTVHFDMEVYDAYGVNTQGAERRINILWIGGCYNPEGDQYSLCALPLIDLFRQASSALAEAIEKGEQPVFPKGLPVGFGKKFSLQVPDIVSSRPKPSFGPHYGIGYVFFLACAGRFGVLDQDPSAAGNFPIGCFDEQDQPVGAESFVPGYTQIYSFADGRYNLNPVINGLTMDDEPMSDELGKVPAVPPCDVPPQDRNLPPSCTREDAFTACQSYEIDVDVPEDIAEVDPEAKDENGQPLREAVWVDYFTDTGDFDGDIRLVSDAVSGYHEKHEVNWIPPSTPGLSTIWAVVRDARGGSDVIVRYVRVK
jgi:hypothetical protein